MEETVAVELETAGSIALPVWVLLVVRLVPVVVRVILSVDEVDVVDVRGEDEEENEIMWEKDDEEEEIIKVVDVELVLDMFATTLDVEVVVHTL